jgi:Lon protease-like protein
MPHSGLFQLDCEGEHTFRATDRQIEPSGLITASVTWLEQDDIPVDPHHLEICRKAMQRVINRAGDHYFAGMVRPDDPLWISYRLSEALPIAARDKQALLEMRSPAQRLATLSGLLDPA